MSTLDTPHPEMPRMNAPLRSSFAQGEWCFSAEAIKAHAEAWEALVQDFAAAGLTFAGVEHDEVHFTSRKPAAEAQADMDRLLRARCDEFRSPRGCTLATDGRIGDKWKPQEP